MAYTFRGGYSFKKNSTKAGAKDSVIESAIPPSLICLHIPSSDNDGQLIVQENERISADQMIYTGGKHRCPVYSGIAGTVKSIVTAGSFTAVTIENDYSGKTCSYPPYEGNIRDLTADEAIRWLKEKSIYDQEDQGEACPVFEKVQKLVGKAEWLIINCVETAPHACITGGLIASDASKIVGGMKILLKALSLRKGIIAVDNGSKERIRILSEQLPSAEIAGLRILKRKYPQEFKEPLVRSLTLKRIPFGKTPEDCGYAIFSARCCVDIYNAFTKGKPVSGKAVTLLDSERTLIGNVYCPLGTPVKELIDSGEDASVYTGDSVELFGKSILGKSVAIDEAYMNEEISSVCFTDNEPRKKADDCNGCGRCVTHCPVGILPFEVLKLSENAEQRKRTEPQFTCCIGCGICSYICPAHLPLAECITALRKGQEGTVANGEPEKTEDNNKEEGAQ